MSVVGKLTRGPEGSATEQAVRGIGKGVGKTVKGVGGALKGPAGNAVKDYAKSKVPMMQSTTGDLKNISNKLKGFSQAGQATRQGNIKNMNEGKETLTTSFDQKEASDKEAAEKLDDLGGQSKERLNNLYSDLLEMHKEAGMNKVADEGGMDWKDIAKGSLAATGGAMALGGAVHGAKNLYRTHQANKAFENVIENNPELDNERSQKHFEVIKEYAPSVAKQPTVLKSYLTRANRMNLTPHNLVQELSETQSTIDRQSIGRTLQDAAESGPSQAKHTAQFAEKTPKSTDQLQMKLSSMTVKEAKDNDN